MEPQALVERVYDHVEEGAADRATIACLRLARATDDVFNAVIFLRELYPDVAQLRSAFHEETQHLKDEAREYIWTATQDAWIEERTIEKASSDPDNNSKLLAMGVGEIIREIEQMESSIRDFDLPAGMGEFDTAAFTDRNQDIKIKARLKIRACNLVLERVRTRCLLYATRVERQLRSARSSSSFVESVQNSVHNFYAERSESVYQKLRRADALVDSANPEDHALLLTSIRRAVRAVADYHYPPQDEPVECHDGETRELGPEQYLNRLHEFCASRLVRNTSNDLLRAELDYLVVFVRRLNDVASKGVHAEVSRTEARQGLLGAYMFLSNLIAKLEGARPVSRVEEASRDGDVQ